MNQQLLCVTTSTHLLRAHLCIILTFARSEGENSSTQLTDCLCSLYFCFQSRLWRTW